MLIKYVSHFTIITTIVNFELTLRQRPTWYTWKYFRLCWSSYLGWEYHKKINLEMITQVLVNKRKLWHAMSPHLILMRSTDYSIFQNFFSGCSLIYRSLVFWNLLVPCVEATHAKFCVSGMSITCYFSQMKIVTQNVPPPTFCHQWVTVSMKTKDNIQTFPGTAGRHYG